MGDFVLPFNETIFIGVLASIAVIVYLIMLILSIINVKDLRQRQKESMANSRLLFTQLIIFAIEIFRMIMNIALIWYAFECISEGKDKQVSTTRFQFTFDLTLVIS